jgi:hypothetical protein
MAVVEGLDGIVVGEIAEPQNDGVDGGMGPRLRENLCKLGSGAPVAKIFRSTLVLKRWGRAHTRMDPARWYSKSLKVLAADLSTDTVNPERIKVRQSSGDRGALQ